MDEKTKQVIQCKAKSIWFIARITGVLRLWTKMAHGKLVSVYIF
jgi:hypothetical protein